MPQIEIDCSKYDCKKLRKLLEDEEARTEYLKARGVDPASDRANSFIDDVLRIYIKCCWQIGEQPLGVPPPPPPPPPGIAGGSTVLAGGLVGGTLVLGGGQSAAQAASAALARALAAVRVVPVWGWAVAYFLLWMAATRKECIDHVVICLESPKKTSKNCVDCVLRCNRTGSWPYAWCNG
jgi:hypothetical protein